MPQMAPISWLILFIVFSGSFLLFNIMNYFLTTPSSPKSTQSKKLIPHSMNWKW